MGWLTVTARTWEEFTHFMSLTSPIGTAPPFIHSNVFRGQADAAWDLKPSIARILHGIGDATTVDVERAGIQEFRKQAHLGLSPHVLRDLPPEQLLGWWALMQHYGSPTRLVDWTNSPYVAAYFAVAGHWDRPGCVWVVSGAHLDHHNRQRGGTDLHLKNLGKTFLAPEGEPRIYGFCTNEFTDRMIAQQGYFTVCSHPLHDHAEVLGRLSDGIPKSGYLRVVIPARLKKEFLHRLRYMNISANALFPGIDGIGRSVAELYQLWSNPPGDPVSLPTTPPSDGGPIPEDHGPRDLAGASFLGGPGGMAGTRRRLATAAAVGEVQRAGECSVALKPPAASA